jgi:hypothetical protein
MVSIMCLLRLQRECDFGTMRLSTSTLLSDIVDGHQLLHDSKQRLAVPVLGTSSRIMTI